MKTFRVSLILAVLAIGSTLLVSCGPEKPKDEPGPKQKPDMIFVLIDALRKDHVSAYGYGRNTTPFIDGVAADGLLFEGAVSQSPWTETSMSSIFTSKYPSQVGVKTNEGPSGKRDKGIHYSTVLKEQYRTLPEILAEAGYETVCVTSQPYVSDKFGLTQGFKHVYELFERRADAVVDKAVEHIGKFTQRPDDGGRPPLFLYVHLVDVHQPTDPPPPYDTLYPTVDMAPHQERYYRWDYYNADGLDTEGFRIFESHKLALYDGELSFLDAQLRRLADYLKEKGLYGDAVIVIASDHGEEFWEHARFERSYMEDMTVLNKNKEQEIRVGFDHGHTMFRELLDVPLVFSGPGVPKGRVGQQVRNMDIAPTLLGIAGIKYDGLGMEGVDLVGLLRKNELKPLMAFSEDVVYGYEKKCLQDHKYKYIRYTKGHGTDGVTEFLFDKRTDPAELQDVSKSQPEALGYFRAKYDAVMAGHKEVESETAVLDDETKARLRSLGYLQ